MAHLYVNSKGTPWRKHSYSAGCDFDQCPYKYYLRRVLGWKERDNRASFMFGRALEESIQFHHDNNGQGAADDFLRRWAVHEKNGELKYTNAEKDWLTCKTMGHDMIRLYVAVQPSLPIYIGSRSVFQREYAKEVFPNDPNYGGIEDAGKLDIISYAEPTHPLLPAITWKSEDGAFRPLIVDIKTSAVEFPEQPGMAAFDSQLRRYSWLSGIRDVSLLWFKKCGLGYKRGYTATVIDAGSGYAAGEQCVIAAVDGAHAWVVRGDFLLDEMDKVRGKKGKSADESPEAEARVLGFLNTVGARFPLTSLTKQKMQFNAGRVSNASADDAGRIAQRQIIQIVNAWKNKEYPNTFGVRYPKDDRNDAYFRAFVLEDEMFKKQTFVKSDEASFDNLFDEDPE